MQIDLLTRVQWISNQLHMEFAGMCMKYDGGMMVADVWNIPFVREPPGYPV